MSLCDLLERAAAGLRAAQGDQAGQQPGDSDDGEPEEERGAGHQRGQQEGAHRPAQVPASVSQGEPAGAQAGREVLGGEGIGHLEVGATTVCRRVQKTSEPTAARPGQVRMLTRPNAWPPWKPKRDHSRFLSLTQGSGAGWCFGYASLWHTKGTVRYSQ